MDFKNIKSKALKLRDKTKTWISKAKDWVWKLVNYWASKISNTRLVISDKKVLTEFIETSKTKTNDLWNKVKKTIIVIFIEKDDEYYNSALYQLPIFYTKARSQNTYFRLCNLNKKDIDKEFDFSIKEFPALIVFENKKIIKKIEWKENIKKVVKSLSLDINKTINIL